MPNTSGSAIFLDAKNISKSFTVGDQNVTVLTDISFQVLEGDFLIIFGPSGSGKSTILHIILGLEPPTKGSVSFLGQNLYADTQTEDTRSNARKKHIGMVYQQSNWIKSLSVKDNVAFPLLLLGQDKRTAQAKAMEFLTQVDMQDWAAYKPTELSGGQQQRVSLARALINNPTILIADEPTGNLDFESGTQILELLQTLNTKHGKTIIMVTHDLGFLTYATRAIRIFDGKVAEELTAPHIKQTANQHQKMTTHV